MRGDQLTGGVKLTVGDELTGGNQTLTRLTEAAMPAYMEVKLMVTSTNHRPIGKIQCNLPLEDGRQIFAIKHHKNCECSPMSLFIEDGSMD